MRFWHFQFHWLWQNCTDEMRAHFSPFIITLTGCIHSLRPHAAHHYGIAGVFGMASITGSDVRHFAFWKFGFQYFHGLGIGCGDHCAILYWFSGAYLDAKAALMGDAAKWGRTIMISQYFVTISCDAFVIGSTESALTGISSFEPQTVAE